MKLTDFLGHEYGPGDLVVYAAMSGRCANMIFGRVVEIYRVAYVDFNWVRLDDDEPVPRKIRYDGEDMSEEDTALRVKVQPLRGARWEQHRNRDYYIDTRSGKRIDPDAPSGKHILKPSHYVFADGREYNYEGVQAEYNARHRGPGMYLSFDQHFRRICNINYGTPGEFRFPLTPDAAEKQQLWWVRRTYQPWVEKRSDGVKPVTLTVTDNIVKWEGELPDADVPVQMS